MTSDNYWDRWANRRISRRRTLAGTAMGATGVAAGLLVGCGDDDDEPQATATTTATSGASGTATATGTSTAPAQGQQGGTWRAYGDIAREPHNPAVSTNTAAAFWNYIGDTALTPNAQTQAIEPALVEKYEVVSEDTIVLTVRDAKWHNRAPVNGRAITAEDVATALMTHAGRMDTSGGAVNYPRKGSFNGVDTIEATGDKTVTIKMSQPTNAIIPNLADWRLPLFPAEQLEIGFDDANQLIGSGPWMAEPGYADGRDLSTPYRLTRNPDYWRPGIPYIDEISATQNQDQAARLSAFLAGEIDSFATFRTPKVELDALISRAGDAQFHSWKFGHWHYTLFNAQKAPWTDPRVRRAIFLAIDHEALGNGFYGEGRWQFTGPLAYTFFEFALQPDELGTRLGWDPLKREEAIAEARRLMEAAGADQQKIDISDLIFALPMNSANGIRIKDQLESTFDNVEVTLDEKPDSATFYAQTAELTFDLQAASIYPVPSPVAELTNHYHSTGGRNYGKYANPDVDAGIQAALAIFDNEELRERLLEVQELILEDMPTMVHYAADLSSMYSSRVRGLEDAHGPGRSTAMLEQLWLDQG